MGTGVRLVFYAPDAVTAQAAADAAFLGIQEIDQAFSDYREDSEVSLLNASGSISASDSLFEILDESANYSQLTAGAFDVTVGPAVGAWREGRLPDRATRERIGWRKVLLDPETGRVEFGRKGMQIDLGAIGKGYAGDRVLEILDLHGIDQALVDIGGDLSLGEPPPGKKGWEIALAGGSSIHASLCGIATSGTTERWITVEGETYSHILDPRTGKGIQKPCQVTVIGKNGLDAEALATAVAVLGPEKGIQLIERIPWAEARIQSEGKISKSSGFPD